MSNQNASLAKEIEDLINKSIEANKVFLNESSKLVRKAITPGEKTTSNLFDANFLTDAFTAYTRLNIQHMKNMLDLGVSLVKQTNTQTSVTAEDNAETKEEPEPAFTLQGEVEAGGKTSLTFLLDNIKQESVVCDLVNTSYTFQSDPSTVENFNTNFSPQSFLLNTGEQKRITIDIDIPQSTKAGVYSASVQVKGFEPAFFSILLTVTETRNKTATNARKTTKKS